MYAVRSLARPSRRTILLFAGIGVAILLSAALVLEPPRSSSGDRGGPLVETTSSDTSTVEPTPGSEPNVAAEGIDAAKSDAVGGAPAPARDAASFGAADGDAAIAPSSGEVAPTGSSNIAPPELDAKIVRTGSVELRVKRAGFEDAWGDAQAVATANGGYIVAASRSGVGDGARVGTITMRIPTARFDAAVDRLRDVSGAKVRRLDVTSQDVTQEHVDVTSRLRHDRAVEARLLALLAQTKTVSEVLAVQSRLDTVQEQIELSKGRLGYLDKMTAMSTIEVSITAPAKAGTDDDRDEGEPGVLAQSFGDAKERFEGNVAGAIVWFGGALPTLVLLAMIALVARSIWRRTRPATPVEAPENTR